MDRLTWPMKMNTERITVVGFVLILGGAVLLLCGLLTTGHNWGDDFAGYIMQARSIVESTRNDFIESNRWLIENSSYPIGPVAYPWGFSLLLAPVYSLFGINIFVFKFVGVFFYIIFLISLWFLLRDRHTPAGFLFIVSMLGFNPIMLGFVNNVLSDIPFLCLSTLGVLLIKKHCFVDNFNIKDYLMQFVTVAIMLMAFFVRTNGILLFLVFMIFHFYKYMALDISIVVYSKSRASACITKYGFMNIFNYAYKYCIVTLPCIVFLVCVCLWSSFFQDGGGSHLASLKNVSFETILYNAKYYAWLMSLFFETLPYNIGVYVAGFLFFCVGLTVRFRTDFVFVVYIFATYILYVVWPSQNGLRFLFPVIPFCLSFMVAGVESLLKTINNHKADKMVALFAVCMVGFLLAVSAGGVFKNMSADRYVNEGPFSVEAQEIFHYIKNNTSADATIIFSKPRAMQLMTDRKSIMVSNQEQLSRGDYVCIYYGSENHAQISSASESYLINKGYLALVYENKNFKFYRRSVL